MVYLGDIYALKSRGERLTEYEAVSNEKAVTLRKSNDSSCATRHHSKRASVSQLRALRVRQAPAIRLRDELKPLIRAKSQAAGKV